MSSTGGGIIVARSVVYRGITISGTKEDLISLASETSDEGLKEAILAEIADPPEIPPGGTQPE